MCLQASHAQHKPNPKFSIKLFIYLRLDTLSIVIVFARISFAFFHRRRWLLPHSARFYFD